MEKWIQLTLPIQPEKDEIVLPAAAREEVIRAAASLLLQVLSVEEGKEAEDDSRS